jgi:hypothetical protein
MENVEVRKFKMMGRHGGQNLGEMEIEDAKNFVRAEREKDAGAQLVEITKEYGGILVDLD